MKLAHNHFPYFENPKLPESRSTQSKPPLNRNFVFFLNPFLHYSFPPCYKAREWLLEIRNLEIRRPQRPPRDLILNSRVPIKQQWWVLKTRDQHPTCWSTPHGSQLLVVVDPLTFHLRCCDILHTLFGDGTQFPPFGRNKGVVEHVVNDGVETVAAPVLAAVESRLSSRN